MIGTKLGDVTHQAPLDGASSRLKASTLVPLSLAPLSLVPLSLVPLARVGIGCRDRLLGSVARIGRGSCYRGRRGCIQRDVDPR
ncbi:MAG: hypothetical protein AAF436_20785 [Myxococcota bacterium]